MLAGDFTLVGVWRDVARPFPRQLLVANNERPATGYDNISAITEIKVRRSRCDNVLAPGMTMAHAGGEPFAGVAGRRPLPDVVCEQPAQGEGAEPPAPTRMSAEDLGSVNIVRCRAAEETAADAADKVAGRLHAYFVKLERTQLTD